MSKIIKNQISKYFILVAIGGFSYFGGASLVMDCTEADIGESFFVYDDDSQQYVRYVVVRSKIAGMCEVKEVEDETKPVDTSLVGECANLGGGQHQPICAQDTSY